MKKVWVDANNQDSYRPDSLTVNLLANGTETDKSVVLSDENDWEDSIIELDAKKDGKLIAYTWSEQGLPEGYTLTNEVTEGIITTLTNTRDLGSLKIKKTVHVSGTITDTTLVDGAYIFHIQSQGAVKGIQRTVEITIENGKAVNARIDDTDARIEEDGTVIISGLQTGKYSVIEDESGLGEGVTLTKQPESLITVDKDGTAEIPTAEFINSREAKKPEFEKKIKDTNDTTGETSGWQDSADYDIGDAVPYRLTAKLADNVSDYLKYHITFHDTMEEGLTFNGITSVTVNGTEVTDYELKSEDHSFDLTLTWTGEEGKRIADASLNEAEVEVLFTATLNSDAILGSYGNVNEGSLEYSCNPKVDSEGNPSEDTEETEKRLCHLLHLQGSR
uniref:Peptidoglycan linked protein-fimbrial structural subunit-(LPXTG motif) n=1 Tax=uncultured bacterium Contigcl_24 TaxID=1393668 RepID=W0FL39_9BACT|nr:peptidoglycan linked protein-fimbrial structural subunit-(LPXTG motif) [uncultured bacterium Contigcl_24]